MPDLGKILPVEPEDHDAFCKLFSRYGPYAARIHAGAEDADWRLQILARHRLLPELRAIMDRSLSVTATYLGTGSIEINPANLGDTKALYDILSGLALELERANRATANRPI